MRKIIVLEHISQDGIIQSPGGQLEDPSNGFNHGGWISPYSDEMLGNEIRRHMKSSFDLLLGRFTYDLWAKYWPNNDGWPEANQAIKYVASNTLNVASWEPSIIMKNNIVDQIKEIKHQEGRDIHIWGSSNLLQTLFKYDLIDELCLFVYPVSLGKGKKLFVNRVIPKDFQLVESKITTKGVKIVKYKRY